MEGSPPFFLVVFPPYMGGCIGCGPDLIDESLRFLPTWEGVSGKRKRNSSRKDVSSLHGRVYRYGISFGRVRCGFLPTWEGVS